jgi:nucleotide-binding universal stress UspA family protein
MFRSIVVPVDGSPLAERALPYAITLARTAGARLRLVRVHEPWPVDERAMMPGNELAETQVRHAEQGYLREQARRIEAATGTKPDVSLLTGPAAASLARFAVRRGVDLIVMTTHGRGGLSRSWLGSVSDGLVRRMRVPLFLVRASESAAPAGEVRIRRVLVAVDGSEPAEEAVTQAATLCAAMNAECAIIRVVTPPTHLIAPYIPDSPEISKARMEERTADAEAYLGELLSRFPALASTRTEAVRGDDVATSILRSARNLDADVIAIGTRGRGRAARFILGSVADKVIRTSDVPVLVCPLPERASAQRER